MYYFKLKWVLILDKIYQVLKIIKQAIESLAQLFLQVIFYSQFNLLLTVLSFKKEVDLY